MKTCTRCGRTDKEAVFYVRQTICKECSAGRMKEWRVTMRDKDLQGSISLDQQIELNKIWKPTNAPS